MKDQLFTFAKSWGFGNSKKEENKEEEELKKKIQKPVNLNMVWGINDWTRLITSINLSSNFEVAATTDKYGRVMLIDMKTYTISKMWKGYREAQVGFLEKKMDFKEIKTETNLSLFLVIYAPLRGILEMWKMRHGPREAMINVGLGCKLIQTNKLFGSTTRSNLPSRLYLLHSEGDMEEIIFSASLDLQIKSDQKRLEQINSMIEAILQNPTKSDLGEVEVTEEQEEKIQQILSEIVYPKTLVTVVKQIVSVPIEFDLQYKVVSHICEVIRENESKEKQAKLQKKQKHYQTNTQEISQLICIEKLMHYYAEISSATLASQTNVQNEGQTETLEKMLGKDLKMLAFCKRYISSPVHPPSFCLFCTFFTNLDISNVNKIVLKEDINNQKIASFVFSCSLTSPDEMLAELIETLSGDVKLSAEEIHSLFLIWFFEENIESLLKMPAENLFCIFAVTELLSHKESLDSLLSFCHNQSKIEKLSLFVFFVLKFLSQQENNENEIQKWNSFQAQLDKMVQMYEFLPPNILITKKNLENSNSFCKIIASLELEGEIHSEKLKQIEQHFPIHFSQINVILAHKFDLICSEMKNVNLFNPENISKAISFVHQVEGDSSLRGGIQILIWEKYFAKYFMEIANFVQNKKKYPTERDCNKLLEISYEQTVLLLKNMRILLTDIFSQINRKVEIADTTGNLE